jgi:sugar lactone lactonase YvrE
MLGAVLTAMAWAAVCLPSTALAHAGDDAVLPFHGRMPDQPDVRKVGKKTYRYLPGREEYEVTQPGRRRGFLHLDYAPTSPNEYLAAEGPAVNLPSNELDPVCRSEGPRIVVVYTHRSSDGTPTPTSTLRSIVKRMNWKISDQSSQSSAGKRVIKMAVDCSGGQINVYNVATANNNFANLSAAVASALLGEPAGEGAIRYLIFDHAANEEGSSAVGIAGPTTNESIKDHFNDNAYLTKYALIYNATSVWENHTTVHELMHSLGASQGQVAPAHPNAPYSTPGHHCEDGLDVLCYPDGTGGYFRDYCPYYAGYETPTTVPIDCNKDTYFNAAPPAESWLAEYWNVAGPEDWFLTAPPTATTEAATEVKGKSAKINGVVNPEGTLTSIYFEYGKTTSYGTKKFFTSGYGPGANGGPEPAFEFPSGLALGTTYHYRVVAVNRDGVTVPGKDMTFTTTTPPVPTVTAEAASGVGSSEATLNATVNPNGTPTTYQFEYGKSTSYGKVVPSTPGTVFENEKKSQKVTFTVEPNTVYHYRVKAENEGGITYGEDKTFSTPRTITAPTFSSAFGSKGTGNGQFTSAYGLSVDPSGNVWVIDKTDNRIQKFNSKGEFLLKAGAKGKGDGQLESPWGIATDSSGNVWVADSGNNRIQKFNSNGEYVSKFGSIGSGNGQFEGPRALAFDPSGNLWVLDSYNSRIQKFNSKGEFLLKGGSYGSGNGQLSEEPFGIATDSSGNVWVADTLNQRLEQFDSEGRYLSQVGGLKSPTDLVVDSAGTLWYTSSSQDVVYGVYPEGEVATQFGSKGGAENQFSNLLLGIDIDPEGNFRVVDNGSSRVMKWVPGSTAVSTNAASQVKRSEATLNAQINPEGKATSYQFEWGTSNSYGNKVPLSPKSIGSGSSPVKVAETIKNLKAGTTYYYHVVATGEKGTIYGETRHFTTLAGPGAEAKWRIGGKTLAELGITEATFVSGGGTFTMEIPGKGITISCTESSGSGKVSGANALSRTLTLNCKIPKDEAHCTYKPITLSLTGTGTSLTSTFEYIYLQTAAEECSTQGPVKPPVFSVEVGTEATKVPSAVYGTGTYGGFSMLYTGYSTWELTGAQVGKKLGFW